MWLFTGVCFAISTPQVRAVLESVFAELSVVFYNSLALVALALSVVFVGAVAISVQQPQSLAGSRVTTAHAKNHITEAMDREPVSSSLTSSSKAFATGGALLKTLFFASTMLPLTAVVASPRTLTTTRHLASNVPFTLADNATALASLQSKLTQCKYSKGLECIDNPATLAEFGVYKREPGYCVSFDTTFVNVSANNPTPNRFLPIGAQEGHARGFKNKFSEWSSKNRDQFQVDCPFLYNETVAKGSEYLCCTEDQYSSLKTQVRMIPGLCKSCKENLRNIFCQMACSPNNSMFLDVNQVRLMPGDAAHEGDVYPAIEELTYYVGTDWVRDIYDYCLKDSSFSLLCNPKQNCTDGFGLMEFMGEYKLNTIGSPLQINITTIQRFPDGEQKEKFCTCGTTNVSDCWSPMDTRLSSCAGVCGSLCAVDASAKRVYHPACYGSVPYTVGSLGAGAGATVDAKWAPLMEHMAEVLETTNYDAFNYLLASLGGVLGLMLILGFLYVSFRTRKYSSLPSADRGRPGPFIARAVAEDQRLSFVDDMVTARLKSWGAFVARGNNPIKIIGVVLVLTLACSAGVAKVEVETDPVKLWVAESSRPFKERDRFGELFMPFYRSQQVILVPKDGGTINRVEYLREAIRIQTMVADVTAGPADAAFPERVKLEDVCWKVTGTSCTVNAITQYFQNRMDHFEFYAKYDLALEHFAQCLYSPPNSDVPTCGKLSTRVKASGETIPTSMSDCPCLSGFGAPMNLYNTYLGGFPAGADKNTTLYLQARAFVSSALVYNYYDKALNAPAIQWERAYIEMLKHEAATNALFTIYFMAETSVQDEIEVESSGDVLPVALSYTLMIVYVSLGINRWSFNKKFFQTSKISVGFLGIVCIMLSVVTTIGLFTWAGVKLQLVIMEVVPFLTLAIGVDNIFLIVHAVNQKHDELLAAQPALFAGLEHDAAARKAVVGRIVSEGLGYIAPSIFMASLAESVAFAFGCISPMPAVLWFAAFACVAVAINFCVQMTLLVSIVTLDKRRELSGNYDLLWWKRASGGPVWMQTERFVPMQPKTPEESEAPPVAVPVTTTGAHMFDRCVDAYSWFLSLRVVKLFVLLLFLSWTLLSITSIETLKHGLPQAESMPSDSYLTDYFNALDVYLATGAPVYFVVEGGYGRNPPVFDLNDQAVQAKFCKSKAFCDEFAIPKIIDALANEGDRDVTHFSEGTTYSWMDDFWGFVNPDSECCRVDSKNGSYLPILADDAAYSLSRPSNPTCLAAKTAVPPVPKSLFMSLFSMFSTASAGNLCSYGGGSIYRGQFSVDDKPIPVVTSSTPQIVLNQTSYGNQITAFSYMVVATANPTQQHFIDAYAQARRAAAWISEKTGVDVWAYSLTYVFFDQYLTVVRDTYTLVGLALAAIFVVHAIYFGGLLYPLAIALAAANIVIQVMGLMRPNDILLNGLSMVNLIIAAGIGVEFCGHYVRMFAKARGSGDERAKIALRKVLVSVLFGITITKVVGLSALTLADSRIFKKYYFRMYMMVVLSGVLNGMLLLPVLLSIVVDVKHFFARQRQAKRDGGDGSVQAAESPSYQGGVDTVKLVSPAGGSGATRHSNSD
ncbi:hypothetical protein PybrP1_011406 [[Pythium] brassicae (nom. inval.)]|nr:hypothetical protein PybrP1_011406 [[Pythium] brassicae (nom. inval.)]